MNVLFIFDSNMFYKIFSSCFVGINKLLLIRSVLAFVFAFKLCTHG